MDSWIFYTFNSNARLLIFMLKLFWLWSALVGWLLHSFNVSTLLFLEQFLTPWCCRMFLTPLPFCAPALQTVISPWRLASFDQRTVSDEKSHALGSPLVGCSEITLQLSVTGLASPGGLFWSMDLVHQHLLTELWLSHVWDLTLLCGGTSV